MVALTVVRDLRLGPTRLTPYGACASVGVLAAMALSGRTARLAQVSAEAAWDAGLFAILSCFVASRLLLVLRDPHAFLHYPFLILSLPSLTMGGLLLAGLLVFAYVRRRRWPLLRLMDAFAPCGAVLAAFLELGHFLDGSEPGMPILRGNVSVVVGYRPVSLYGLILSLILAVGLWWLLRNAWPPGSIAALGMMLGAFAAFGLDLLSLPSELFGALWLEPGQIVALSAMLAGAVLWTFASQRSPAEPSANLGDLSMREAAAFGDTHAATLQEEGR